MIGVDVVDVDQFAEQLSLTPGLEERLFTSEELQHAASQPDRVLHLAGVFAAKEAVIKALGLLHPALSAQQISISHDADGRPLAAVHGPGGAECDISISHDAGIAVAVAIRL